MEQDKRLMENKRICNVPTPLSGWPWEYLDNFKACTLLSSPLFLFLVLHSLSLTTIWLSILVCLCVCVCVLSFIGEQYLLYGPLVAKVLYAFYRGQIKNDDTWCLHILILFVLRAFVHQFWSTYSCMLFLNRTRRINDKGVEFNQIDAEWHWYDLCSDPNCWSAKCSWILGFLGVGFWLLLLTMKQG